MKIVISGGGTGGHIYPALTIADKIKELSPTAEITFVGTREGLEKDIVPRYGYKLEFIEVAGFKRSFSLDTLRSGIKLCKGIKESLSLLNKLKPDLVIGTGGYVCGPILFLAALKGIPTCIQEQNALPGVTNKILARYVKKVFLGYKEAEKYFSGSSKKIYTGNPIRKDIINANINDSLENLKLAPDKKTILVSGGSRGAASINKAMLYVEKELAGRCDVQILHITGNDNYDKYMEEYHKLKIDADNIIVKPYLHNMPEALAVTDIAVFRAGAIGLAELTAKGIPSILIPYPYATANHQEFNARALEKSGAAVVVLDKELTGEKLLEEIEKLLVNKERLILMQKAAKALGKPNASTEIVKQALEMIKNDRR